MKKRTNPLPLLDGVKPSYLVLPHEKQFYGLPLLHFLCTHFPFVGEETWRRRLNSGFTVIKHRLAGFEQGILIKRHAIRTRQDDVLLP